MSRLILLLSLLLTGCFETIPDRVEVPTPVPCVAEKPKRPTLLTDDDLKRMSDYQMALALRQYHLTAGGYIGELEAVVDGCSKIPPLSYAPIATTP